MNIFRLDENPTACAKYHVDKHVNKLVIETAQLLSTAHHVLDPEHVNSMFYKPTHKNHPCAIWVRECEENYNWTHLLLAALLSEYKFRYGKIHKCNELWGKLAPYPKGLKKESDMPIPLCMPDECKIGTPVESYRNYYLKHKSHMFSWKNREIPYWVKQDIETYTRLFGPLYWDKDVMDSLP